MSKSRASIFGSTDDDDGGAAMLDVASFSPKAYVDQSAPPAEKVRAVSQAAKFPSREPSGLKTEVRTTKRPHRRYRTGRNVQLSVKALAETVAAFYAITDQQHWVLGYTLQRAIEALQRELKQGP